MSATWVPGITPSREIPAEIDTSVAHPARVYDHILGGKNNFAADQAAARAALTANPALATEFARFFTGLELVPPGIAPMAEWRAEPEPGPRPAPAEASAYAAVARKN